MNRSLSAHHIRFRQLREGKRNRGSDRAVEGFGTLQSPQAARRLSRLTKCIILENSTFRKKPFPSWKTLR